MEIADAICLCLRDVKDLILGFISLFFEFRTKEAYHVWVGNILHHLTEPVVQQNNERSSKE